MSRSHNQHKKTWNFPMHEAQKWSNKMRRAYGKELIAEYKKENDPDEVELPVQIDKDAGKGDIWKWD